MQSLHFVSVISVSFQKDDKNEMEAYVIIEREAIV